MEIGVTLRSMGRASSVGTLGACAERAEEAGFDALWLPDHIAIPPDDAEGSQGRYLDALATLSWIAGRTRTIGLGLGVLVLPYRRPLPTARWLATIQELSGGRLRAGVGVGWMEAEFRALGIDRSRRGRDSDAVLACIETCFRAPDDIAVCNGQPFLFRPRPARPPILVGGAAPHALTRAARFGDGWFPMGADPAGLAPGIAELRARFADAGKAEPQVVALGALPADDPPRAHDLLAELERIGVTHFVHGARYDDEAGFARAIEPALEQIRG